MKTITFKQKKNSVSIKLVIFFLVVLAVGSVNAQVQNNEPLHIGDQGYVYIESDAYYFGSGSGQTTTTRTASTYGKLIFSSAASSSGASDLHYLDGYGSVLTTSPFDFPIGQSGVYAPARVTPSTTSPIDAAYYRTSATTIGTTLDASVSAVSNTEYWNIQGANTATLSLTWRASSTLSNIVLSTTELTIIGYDGTKWVEIPSAVDITSILGGVSSMTAGSITSTATIDLSAITYFTLGARGDSCPPLIASSGNTKIWNGSWSPSAPTLDDPAIINTPYSGGSFACNSLVLNADVTLADGQNVEIVYGVTGSNKFVMASEASVIQRASGVSAPNIELTKKSRSVMRRFDYIYWGTPIAGNFISQLSAAQASTATLANAFDLKYKYVSGSGGGWQNLTATETGRGFITRIKSQAPFTNATNTDFINLKFTGVANNGDIIVPVTNNPSSPNGGTSHVLLANPYPSAIDADKFLTDNTDIDGVVYIWTGSTVNNGTGQVYTQADYIAHTLAGSVIPNGIPTTFTGKIASGQGFKVKSLTNSGAVTFTNCMRLTGDNNQFYRNNFNEQVVGPKDRFKLNMTGNTVFSQILVAYIPEATIGYDRMYDAGRNSVSTVQLFSVFEGDGRKLSINARPNFVNTDVVPLGITKADATPENFTISITDKEGVFNTPDVNVYIHDILNNTYHNLNNSDFTFNSNVTSLLGRYEIVYQGSTLSNPDYDNTGVIANIRDNSLSIIANKNMVAIEVFDIAGRKIFESKIENNTLFTAPFYRPQAVYIAKVKLDNGTVATIKLVNED